MGMMERYMEVMGGMLGGLMGGGAMGAMLLVVTFLLFVWILGLATLGGFIVWGVRRLSER